MTASSWSPSACSAVSWVSRRTSISGCASMRSIRYADIDLLSRSPRTSCVTRAFCVREVEHGLAGRIACADDDDVLPRALPRLAPAGAVVDPVADELVESVQVELAPVHAGGGEDDGGCDLVPAFHDEPDRLVGAVHAASPDAAQEHQLGAEPLGLAAGEAGELGAADPVGEAEEVLDARGVGRLAAGDVADRRPAVLRPSEAA